MIDIVFSIGFCALLVHFIMIFLSAIFYDRNEFFKAYLDTASLYFLWGKK